MTSKRICDSDLRSELKRFGFSPGPITDGTRSIYLKKLNEFKRSSSSASNGVQTASGRTVNTSTISRPSCTSPINSHAPTTPPQSSGANGFTPVHTVSSNPPPCSSTDTDSSQDVLQCLLRSLDLSHVAMDTVFLFSDGELLGASRAVMATQCPAMVPLLYNKEELFAVNVRSTTGQCCFYVRANEYVADLQEKIALSEGIHVARQRLIFNCTELNQSSTLAGCGISPGAIIRLELLPMDRNQLEHTTRVVNPSLSISHFRLKLGLERLVPCVQSPTTHHPHLAIPPQTMHIVHMYDIPSVGFRMLVRYLYCRQLTVPGGADSVVHLVVCCVLGSSFGLPSLSHLCLIRVRELLDKNTASLFVGFSEQIGLEPLVQVCKEHLAQYS